MISYSLAIRPNWIDKAKVFMIYLVVLGHYTYAIGIDFQPSSLWNLMHIITLFHMPFFFIVSGYLFKSGSIKETICKGWVQLIRPYLIMCIVSCVFMIVNDLIACNFSWSKCLGLTIGVFTGNDGFHSIGNWSSALWFCYSLFIIKIINHSSVFFERVGLAIFFFVLVVLMAIVVLYSGNIFPFRLDSSIVGLFFFVIGYMFKECIRKIMSSPIILRFFVVLGSSILLFVSGYYNLNLNVRQGLSINVCSFGEHPLLFLISGISGFVTVSVLSSFFRIKCGIVKKIILQISNGTIVVLGFHWLVYKLVFGWWLSSYNVVIAIFVALLDFALCYVLILLASKYCPYILGYRKIN